MLSSYCFDLDFYLAGPSEVDYYSLMLPRPDEMARVVLKKGDTELVARTASTNTPVVEVTSPIGGEVWSATDTYTITWTASDADGDSLVYTVLYSPDGSKWGPIGSLDLTDTHLAIDVSELAGGSQARIRVLASDGFNESADDSNAPFTVERKAPNAFISLPVQGSIIPTDTSAYLEGYAYDLEDGMLDDTALHWSSSRDGDLGMGSWMLVTLSKGEHIITLAATDSDSSTTTATVNVFVGYSNIHLPIINK